MKEEWGGRVNETKMCPSRRLSEGKSKIKGGGRNAKGED
jgi:hypothetical protein